MSENTELKPQTIEEKVQLSFAEFKEQIKELSAQVRSVVVTDVTQVELMAEARELRLKFVPIRTGVGKRKDKLKENTKAYDAAVMKVHNELVESIKSIESHLLAQENFKKDLEAKERQKLQAERAAQAAHLIDFIPKQIILCDMDQSEFEQILKFAQSSKDQSEKEENEARGKEAIISHRRAILAPFKRYTQVTDFDSVVGLSNDDFDSYVAGLQAMEMEDSKILAEKEAQNQEIKQAAKGDEKDKLTLIFKHLNQRPTFEFKTEKGIEANNIINATLKKLTNEIALLYVE